MALFTRVFLFLFFSFVDEAKGSAQGEHPSKDLKSLMSNSLKLRQRGHRKPAEFRHSPPAHQISTVKNIPHGFFSRFRSIHFPCSSRTFCWRTNRVKESELVKRMLWEVTGHLWPKRKWEPLTTAPESSGPSCRHPVTLQRRSASSHWALPF